MKFKCLFLFVISVSVGVTASAADLNPGVRANLGGLSRTPSEFNIPGRIPGSFKGSFNPGTITIAPPEAPCNLSEDDDPFASTAEPSDLCQEKLPDLNPSCGDGDCVPTGKQRFFYFPKNQ